MLSFKVNFLIKFSKVFENFLKIIFDDYLILIMQIKRNQKNDFRSSFLTGLYAHNHGIMTNNGNCTGEEWKEKFENRTYVLVTIGNVLTLTRILLTTVNPG